MKPKILPSRPEVVLCKLLLNNDEILEFEVPNPPPNFFAFNSNREKIKFTWDKIDPETNTVYYVEEYPK